MLDNGKTESCPAAGASFVRPVEALKDSDLVVSFQQSYQALPYKKRLHVHLRGYTRSRCQ